MFYTYSNIVLRFLLPRLLRLDVRGRERVPGKGPLIVVANHLNLLDPPILGALLRRRITFMAKQEVFDTPGLNLVARWYGAFAVRRGEADRQAIRLAIAVLEQGGMLGMFPEGTRSKTGRLQPGHPGVALIARRTGAPILPVAISGSEQIRHPLSFLTRPVVQIAIGEPFRLDGPAAGNLEAATATMMARIAELLPEHYRPLPGEPSAGAESEPLHRSRPAAAPRARLGAQPQGMLASSRRAEGKEAGSDD